MAENDEQIEQDEQNDEQTDWANLQQLNLQAEQKIVMREFEKFRTRYNARSVFWPILSYENLKLLNRVKKINPSKYASFMKLVAERTNAFWAKLNSILAAIVPILPYILIGALIIIAVIVILSVLMPWLFGLFEGGTSGAPFGVNGENFYGVRYIYRDAEQAQADLWADYATALDYSISNFNDENITLTLAMPYTDGELDLSKLNAEADSGEYADEYGLVEAIAKTVYAWDNAAESADTVDLETALAGIKYFGFDADLVDKIATTLAQEIEENVLYTTAEQEGSATQVAETVQLEIYDILLQEYVTNLAADADAPTRTDLLYIKDYILEDGEDSTVDGIGQENYVAMIYLPKNNVNISSVTYSIFGVNEAEYNVALYLNGSEKAAKNQQNFGVFSSAEESGAEFDSYQFTAENIDVTALSFTDFEKDFLTTEKSLFSILRALKNGSANASLLGNYLSQADDVNTAFWADESADDSSASGSTGGGTQAGGETESGEADTKFYTFNYQNYLAVLMRNSANTAYSFTEYETNLG